MLGGGNYLELGPENAQISYSIDLPEELLKDIHPPISFNALGVVRVTFLETRQGITSLFL